jgi:outer membrane protein W
MTMANDPASDPKLAGPRRSIALVGAAGAVAAAALVLAPGAAGAEPWQKGRVYFRGLGAAHVATLEQSREMELADIDGPASLAVQNGPIEGSGGAASSATIPAVLLGVRLPELSSRLSLELIAGTPAIVKFEATGTLANESIAPEALGIPTGVPALGKELGEAEAVPIVVTAVYQLHEGNRLRPYVGAGAAMMFTRNPKLTNRVLTEVSEPEFTIAPAPGFVVQGGLDVRITKRIYASIDVKFIAGLLARAEVQNAVVRAPLLPLFDSVEVGTAKMSMWVNPLIVQAGVGCDFALF